VNDQQTAGAKLGELQASKTGWDALVNAVSAHNNIIGVNDQKFTQFSQKT